MEEITETPVGDKLAEERIRGEKAKEILQAPLVEEILDDMDAACFAAFKACPMRDTDGLRGLHAQAKAVESFRKNLTTIMQTGQMAEMQIKALEDKET